MAYQQFIWSANKDCVFRRSIALSNISTSEEYKLVGNNVNTFIGLTSNKLICTLQNMTLGQRLKASRKYAKLTQIQLQDKSGVPQQTISNIELEIQDKSTDIVPLAMACGVRPEWLAIESGEMVDGLYIDNSKIKQAVLIMQELPEYAIDEAIKRIDSVAQLIRLAKASGSEK